jgi:hypothetical protein
MNVIIAFKGQAERSNSDDSEQISTPSALAREIAR